MAKLDRGVVREEARRSVAWLVLAFLGWGVVFTSVDRIPSTVVTGLALPIGTALGLTLLAIAVRSFTGIDVDDEGNGGQLLNVLVGSALGGVVFLYLVFVEDKPTWWLLVYLLALVASYAVMHFSDGREPAQ